MDELLWKHLKFKGCGHSGIYPDFLCPPYHMRVCPLCQEEMELLAIIKSPEWERRMRIYYS